MDFYEIPPVKRATFNRWLFFIQAANRPKQFFLNLKRNGSFTRTSGHAHPKPWHCCIGSPIINFKFLRKNLIKWCVMTFFENVLGLLSRDTFSYAYRARRAAVFSNKVRAYLCVLMALTVTSGNVAASSYDNAVEAFKSRRFADAIAQWELGAQDGNSESQYQLGILFAAGLHVPRDLERATAYLKMAADTSHPEAAYALAAVYAAANNTDPVEVKRLLTLSASLADENAKSALEAIRIGIPMQYAILLNPLIAKQEGLLPPLFSAKVDKGPSAIAAGARIVKTSCGACHTTGAAGAPLVGKQSDWAKRRDDPTVMATKIVYGYEACPPKGGNYALSNDEVRTAVIYMLHQVKSLQ